MSSDIGFENVSCFLSLEKLGNIKMNFQIWFLLYLSQHVFHGNPHWEYYKEVFLDNFLEIL